MVINSLKRLFFVPVVLTFLVVESCQKGVDIDLNNPPPVPSEIKDSTLLIKSIAWLYDNGADSIVENYSYDTVNKKITLSWTDSGTDPFDPDYQSEYNNSKAELSYNNKGFLFQIIYTYPASYNLSDYDYESIDIKYDNANIVEQIIVNYAGGFSLSRDISKTNLSDGKYQLDWQIYDPNFPDDLISRSVLFSGEGKSIRNEMSIWGVQSSPSEPPTYFRIDSLIYDDSGSVTKISTSENSPAYGQQNYESNEFNGRQFKGNQLHNQRKLILNGIADMPFLEVDDISYCVGILSFHFEYENYQYSLFPVESAKVRMWDGTFKNFATHSTYDNKNRLTKFTGFFVDNDLEPHEYRIAYFK